MSETSTKGPSIEPGDEICILTVHGMLLPEPLHVDRVRFTGMMKVLRATVWCRRDSVATSGSPVPWDTTAQRHWVVELHVMLPDRDNTQSELRPTIFAVPCPVDPRPASSEADAAIRLAVARFMLHEGQELTLIDGERLDPHEVGEVGLAALVATTTQAPHGQGQDRDEPDAGPVNALTGRLRQVANYMVDAGGVPHLGRETGGTERWVLTGGGVTVLLGPQEVVELATTKIPTLGIDPIVEAGPIDTATQRSLCWQRVGCAALAATAALNTVYLHDDDGGLPKRVWHPAELLALVTMGATKFRLVFDTVLEGQGVDGRFVGQARCLDQQPVGGVS